jgi:hypothetical protein
VIVAEFPGLVILFCVVAIPILVAIVAWLFSRQLWRKGRVGRAGAIAVWLALIAPIGACMYRDHVRLEHIQQKEQHLQTVLTRSLSPGDDREKVERVLRENGLPVNFENFGRCPSYEGHLATEDPETSIIFTVQLDDHQRFHHVAVRTFTTFL